MTVKQSTSADEAKQEYFDNALREKKISEYMAAHNCSLAEAEAAIGKAAPTARDTALVSMQVLGGDGHAAMAKFLDTAEGRALYKCYAGHSEEQPRPMAKVALDALVTAFAKKLGGDRWAAMNAALDTPLGKRLYSLAA